MMRLLVTRPEPEAQRLKARLEELGHEVTVEPLLAVSFDDPDPIAHFCEFRKYVRTD